MLPLANISKYARTCTTSFCNRKKRSYSIMQHFRRDVLLSTVNFVGHSMAPAQLEKGSRSKPFRQIMC